MIRKTIALSVYISLVTALAGAVDVNIPGADNRIPTNAYEGYVHRDSSIKNIQEGALRDFQKSKQYAKTKQLYIENGLSEKISMARVFPIQDLQIVTGILYMAKLRKIIKINFILT